MFWLAWAFGAVDSLTLNVRLPTLLNSSGKEGYVMINYYQQRTRGPVLALHQLMLQG